MMSIGELALSRKRQQLPSTTQNQLATLAARKQQESEPAAGAVPDADEQRVGSAAGALQGETATTPAAEVTQKEGVMSPAAADQQAAAADAEAQETPAGSPGGIPFQRDDPAAWAETGERWRRLGNISGLAGIGGSLVRSYLTRGSGGK